MARRQPDDALFRLVEPPVFTTLVLAVILANAVVLGLQTYDGLVREFGGTLEAPSAASRPSGAWPS